MPTSYASAVIDADVERVWSLVRDFNGLAAWIPAVDASEIERTPDTGGADGGPADRVGCVRRLTLAEGGGTIRERLVDLDDVNRRYSYDILESPFAVRRYRATIRVAAVTDSGRSFVEWWADYDCAAEDERELDTTFARGVFGAGLAGLGRYFGE